MVFGSARREYLGCFLRRSVRTPGSVGTDGCFPRSFRSVRRNRGAMARGAHIIHSLWLQSHYFIAMEAVKKKNSASRKYCFTLFDYEHLRDITQLPEGLTYLVGQIERCPKTERLHFQGYCALTKPMKGPAFQRLIHSSELFHWEIPGGTPEQNKTYCTKEETRISLEDGGFSLELGTMPQQGRRNDILSLIDGINQGRSDRQLAEGPTASAMFKYGKHVSAYRALRAPVRTIKPNVVIYWGPTGKYHC